MPNSPHTGQEKTSVLTALISIKFSSNLMQQQSEANVQLLVADCRTRSAARPQLLGCIASICLMQPTAKEELQSVLSSLSAAATSRYFRPLWQDDKFSRGIADECHIQQGRAQRLPAYIFAGFLHGCVSDHHMEDLDA